MAHTLTQPKLADRLNRGRLGRRGGGDHHAPAAQAPKTGPILAIILACYLMIVLDISVIITALPNIHSDLGFSVANLSWVQNAYAVTFGGLLLLGARAGDLLGRRRMFIVGISLFTFASFLGGVAQSELWLLSARALQGVGAAIAAPSTLALLLVSFPEGRERTRALAAYSAVAGGGGSVGLVLGGLLTTWVSWRAALFINVPIGIALAVASPRFLPETARRKGHFDLAGAITSTVGMTALVFGFVHAASAGWTATGTLVWFVVGALMLAAFIATELRAEQPITPLHLFADRSRSGANGARMLLVGGIFSMFFFVTQYLQGVLGYSALEAGLAFLPMTAILFAMTRTVPKIQDRLGPMRLTIAGIGLALGGMVWLSRLSVDTSYFPGIALPLVMLGVGMGSAMTPLTGAGIAGVAEKDAGAASGIVNVAQQLGGSLGLGILVTVFASAGHRAAQSTVGTADHSASAQQLAHSVSAALTGSAIFMACALAVVVLVMRGPVASDPELLLEAEPA